MIDFLQLKNKPTKSAKKGSFSKFIKNTILNAMLWAPVSTIVIKQNPNGGVCVPSMYTAGRRQHLITLLKVKSLQSSVITYSYSLNNSALGLFAYT